MQDAGHLSCYEYCVVCSDMRSRVLRKNFITLGRPVECIVLHFSTVGEDIGNLPSDWKKAMVTGIYKKGPKSEPEKYRLVSLTCICSNIMEHNQSYLTQLNILLTITLLLINSTLSVRNYHVKPNCCKLLMTGLKSWSRGGQTDVLLLDFSKVPPTRSHIIDYPSNLISTESEGRLWTDTESSTWPWAVSCSQWIPLGMVASDIRCSTGIGPRTYSLPCQHKQHSYRCWLHPSVVCRWYMRYQNTRK